MTKWPGYHSKKVWFDSIGYAPTLAQRPIHQSEARHLLIGGGWRGGKSSATAAEAYACWRAWNLLYIVGDQYENATPEFDYLRGLLHVLGERAGCKLVIRESRHAGGKGPGSLVLYDGENVKRVITISTRQSGYHALTRRGEAPDMVLLVEFEALPFEVWLAARGRVAESRGRVLMSGTFPDDTGWQAQMWERWRADNEDEGQAFSLAMWDNTAKFSGIDDPEIKAIRATVPDAEFMRKYGGIPQKPPTLVFSEFDYPTHVREWVEFDPEVGVEVAVDPGFGESAYAVLAMQEMGPFVFVVDEIHEHGMTGEEIIEEAKNREWWSGVTGGVIDIAGRQHHAAESQVEVWQAKAGIYLRSQQVPLEAGRERLTSFLMKQSETGEPRILFSPKCKKTTSEFGKYIWKKRIEERVVGEKPVDMFCDSIKAISYWLVDRYGVVTYPSLGTHTPTPREDRWREAFKQQRRG